jgi:hypothetical protein
MKLTVALLLAVAGCESDPLRVKCDRIAGDLCTHQIDCDQISSYADCVADARETRYCDPERTLADLDVCLADIQGLTCAESTPASCNVVLCDAATGCGPDPTLTPYR